MSQDEHPDYTDSSEQQGMCPVSQCSFRIKELEGHRNTKQQYNPLHKKPHTPSWI